MSLDSEVRHSVEVLETLVLSSQTFLYTFHFGKHAAVLE